MLYDLIIIGMGISGITAALYAKRGNLKVLVIDKAMPGGLLNNIENIENYPGFTKISGPDLAQRLTDQLQNLKVEIQFDEVVKIKHKGSSYEVIAKKNNYQTRKIIIATGRSQRKLGLLKEAELFGKGISTCALCDGNFFKAKEIAVVGGGNSALQEALYLAKIVKKIYLIHRQSEWTAPAQVAEEVRRCPKIKPIFNTTVRELIEVNGKLGGVILSNGLQLNVTGLFIYIGFTPKTEFIEQLAITDKRGYIKVDSHQQTTREGIYAVGDITAKEVYQLVTGASEGAKAAIAVIASLK